MKLSKYIGSLAILMLCTACPNDDDGIATVPLRDRGEQAVDDDAKIREFLQTHFYNYEEFENPSSDFDYKITFAKIEGDNADKTALIDQVATKTINRFDVDQKLYILTAREGVNEEVIPTFADSSFVRFRGTLISGELDNTSDPVSEGDVFDSATSPIWFNLPATIDGFGNGIAGSKAGSGFMENPDGTTTFENDYGIHAVFIPSGLAYFASPPTSDIPLYSSLIFTFDNLISKINDHDGDGIISINEDIDMNGFLFDAIDNTDGDAAANFDDPNDDNDGVLTRREVVFAMEMNDEGEMVEVFLSLKDTDGDGIPDHLDTDDDGDGRDTIDEIEINNVTGEITFPDTDGDGIPDYLDADS